MTDVAMQAKGCGCGEACACMPAEFVRLRYFYGQRLGVTDLTDAQAYHAGKQRFHNARVHGAGVLCGLTADRFVWPQGAPAGTKTTVLRVLRGAALDACGRELLVSADQCIDVASWYAKNRGSPKLSGWTAAGPQRLFVALRYRECPSDPSPAPRDPCNCDDSGCEYSRVREGFELALFTPQECAELARKGQGEELRAELEGHLAGIHGPRLRRLVALASGLPCPPVPEDPWMCLASFSVTLEGATAPELRVVDVGGVDNTPAERPVLLSTAMLQDLLTTLASVSADEGMLGIGPQLGGLSFSVDAGTGAGRLDLEVRLDHPPREPTPTPLAVKTWSTAWAHLFRFEAGEWKKLTKPLTSSYDANTRQLRFVLAKEDVVKDGRYRLSISPPRQTPVVDEAMRTLRPLRFARHFKLVESSGTLTLTDTFA